MDIRTDETTDINDIRPQTGAPQREHIEPGDYPVLELLGVEEATSEFGKYTYFHVKVLSSSGAGAAPEGSERKIGIRRDAKGKLGVAKAISLVKLLTVLNDQADPTDRNAFLETLKGGGGNGSKFGAKLVMEGKAKIFTFRAPLAS